MNITTNRADNVILDQFVSTSGKYACAFTETFVGLAEGLIGYYIAIVRTSDGQVAKIVRICYDAPSFAREEWEKFKETMTAPAVDEEADEPTTTEQETIIHTDEEGNIIMPTLRPLGPRIIVEEILSEDQAAKRMEAANLVVPDNVKSITRATRGYIIAIGDDPLLREMGLKEGMIVWFAPTAGMQKFINGKRLRTLESHEVTDIEYPDLPESPLCAICGGMMFPDGPVFKCSNCQASSAHS